MPAYPIIELIEQNVLETLSAIVPPEYHTRALVKRLTSAYARDPEGHAGDNLIIIWCPDDPKLESKRSNSLGGNNKAKWIQPFEALCHVIESEDSPVPITRRLHVIRADVEKAILKDRTRGGYALDTILREPNMIPPGVFCGVAVRFDVHYQTAYEDPYSL